ncbi:hypothetical protein, partial [Boudabousia marimammalium]|uniref:hypothetical protein n=1 Tax=Boudabousia marimammalium TaxID=156892 RepID=UPI001C9E7573
PQKRAKTHAIKTRRKTQKPEKPAPATATITRDDWINFSGTTTPPQTEILQPASHLLVRENLYRKIPPNCIRKMPELSIRSRCFDPPYTPP